LVRLSRPLSPPTVRNARAHVIRRWEESVFPVPRHWANIGSRLFPPAVHALAALESAWAMARSTVLMALWHTEGGTMAPHSKVQEPSERRGPLVKTTTRSGRSLMI
jgi:hypothetical protein